MRTRRYRIVFSATARDQARSEEIDAEQIGHVRDGTLSCLNFLDHGGEVLRVGSDSVARVERLR